MTPLKTTPLGEVPLDSDLVAAALEGDREAFGQLVVRYQKVVFNATYRITGSHDDALDAAQSAFVKAYTGLRSFDPTRPFFPWLFRIAINESLDLTSRRGRDRGSGLGTDLSPAITDPTPGPEHELRAVETRDALERALAELTTDQRTVIVLRHIQNHTYDEIAELLRIEAKTVKSRLFSARQALRNLLRGAGAAP